ncbi:hypothetical protein ACUN0C_19445, partial [Faunimonas sp. B44]|uniref:hypothetical protein n=1 Tax=Faunimonas sp. B44 TaxID=3461493 RepID=UPI004043B0FD
RDGPDRLRRLGSSGASGPSLAPRKGVKIGRRSGVNFGRRLTLRDHRQERHARLASSQLPHYFSCMFNRIELPTDLASILALVLGAAVIIPSMVSLGLTLFALAARLF